MKKMKKKKEEGDEGEDDEEDEDEDANEDIEDDWWLWKILLRFLQHAWSIKANEHVCWKC